MEDLTIESVSKSDILQDAGLKVVFRSARYMGLKTWKKKKFYPAVIRKVTDTHTYLVYINPIHNKVYAAIPQVDITNGQVEIKVKADFEYNVLLTLIDSYIWEEIWQDYTDKEAQKQVLMNAQDLEQDFKDALKEDDYVE